jgi:hypothetical protein
MTGGGSTFTSSGQRVTHGFQVRPVGSHSSLQVNWDKKRFHLGELTYFDGSEDAAIDQGQPNAPIDTVYGEGYGTYNGKTAAVIQFTFVDAGEPGVNDIATYKIAIDVNNNKILDAGDTIVLDTSGKLDRGNHQAHKLNTSSNSLAAKLEQQIDIAIAQLDNDNLSDDKVISMNVSLLDLLTQYDNALFGL